MMNVGFRTEKIMKNSLRIQTTKEPSPHKKGEKENKAPARDRIKTSNFGKIHFKRLGQRLFLVVNEPY